MLSAVRNQGYKRAEKKENTDFSCSLCSEHIPVDQMEGVSNSIEEAERRMAASRAAASRAEALAKTLGEQVTANAEALDAAQSALAKAVRSTNFQKRREAELKIARLEGALRERQATVASVEEDPDAGFDPCRRG